MIKSNKHLFSFLILLNHIFQIESTDTNVTYDEMIILKLNTLKQKANNLMPQSVYKSITESGKFNKPNSTNMEKQAAILDRIKNIEKKISELGGKELDAETMKLRMNELESEMENLRKSLDGIFKENIQKQNQLEKSLANVTKRLAIIEEPGRLKELEEQLRKGDYREAKLNADQIVHDDKIIDVMRNVYEKQNDIDGYIYFAGVVDNLSRRLQIYQYIYNDIILKNNYRHKDDKNNIRIQFLSLCYNLKLMSNLENSLIKVGYSSADLYRLYNNVTAVSKNIVENLVKTSYIEDDGSIKTIYRREFVSFNHNISMNEEGSSGDGSIVLSSYGNSSSELNKVLYRAGFYLDEVSDDGWFSNEFLLYDRESIMLLTRIGWKMYESRNLANNNNNKYLRISNYGQMFLLSLREHDYNLALITYNRFKSNKDEIVNVIKNYCFQFKYIDPILNFTHTSILIEDERTVIYTALYDIIDKSDTLNICEMLKLHQYLVNSNQTLTIINIIKDAITLIIKKDLTAYIDRMSSDKIENHFNIKQSQYNELNIYTKQDNNIIAKYRYYLMKNNGIDNCYFGGQISVINYDNWFEKDKRNNGWDFYIGPLTKIRQMFTLN